MAFPLWLLPEQARVLPVSEHWTESAQALVDRLREEGVRADLFDRETLGYRIRDAELHKVPYMAVIGEREAESETVAVRKRGAGKKQEVMSREDFLQLLLQEVRTRSLPPAPEGD